MAGASVCMLPTEPVGSADRASCLFLSHQIVAPRRSLRSPLSLRQSKRRNRSQGSPAKRRAPQRSPGPPHPLRSRVEAQEERAYAHRQAELRLYSGQSSRKLRCFIEIRRTNTLCADRCSSAEDRARAPGRRRSGTSWQDCRFLPISVPDLLHPVMSSQQNLSAHFLLSQAHPPCASMRFKW
jgi:hypothetical protein